MPSPRSAAPSDLMDIIFPSLNLFDSVVAIIVVKLRDQRICLLFHQIERRGERVASRIRTGMSANIRQHPAIRSRKSQIDADIDLVDTDDRVDTRPIGDGALEDV